MHLKQLKLAGFKSFVDPTVVPFPSQLLAVVGPNGCGKSNIIDAVRWVMGESSAKNLRGESMTDVIFNGSSNRKPVGQASVELIFDNSLGRLTGPFASYGEIAVKRIVTRDGDSAYFLNGSRCRRKDITDIFLGTGAGSRGYSIIGQGTISRLIEAKPEELRIFLEEAAGVSKYKERRRETLQRIAHTQENLTRVADIRDELDKQLQRLERQAKAAERYTHLKAEEQLCRAQIVALKWQDFTHQQVQKQHELQELALQYEQQQSNLTHAHSERTQLNEQLHEANDQAQSIQTIFYQLGSEIARLEETIQQHEKEKKRLEHDKQQMQHDWQKAEEQLKQDEEALQNCQQYAHDWQEKLARLQHEFNQQELLLLEQQQQKNLCETAWQESQNKIIDLKSELQIAQVQGDYLEQRRQQIVMRIDKLTTEHQSIAIDDLQSLQIQLNEKQVKLIETQFFDETQLKQSNELCNQQKGHLQDIEQHLHQAQDDFHRLNSEYAALSAAQKAAKQSHQGQELIQWSDKAKLMDVLRVEAPWQAVCEMVLHEELHAYVLDDLQDLWPQWAIFLGAAASVVTMTTPTDRSSRPRLADKIEGCVPHTRQALEHIFIAAHLDEAISWLPELNDYESVVTAEGFWLGKGWVKLASKAEHDEMGLLARAQKISELKVQVNQLQENIVAIRTQRDEVHMQLQQSIRYIELHQTNLGASNEALRELNATRYKNEQELLHAEKLQHTLLDELSELHEQLEDTVTEQMEVSEKINQLQQHYDLLAQQQGELTEQKQEKILALSDLQEQVSELRTDLHKAELEWERECSKAQQLTERINREQERLDVLQERLEQIALLCLNLQNPEVNYQHLLSCQLEKHGTVESQLISSKEHVSQLRMRLEDLEKNNLHVAVEVKKLQEVIAQIRMQEHELAVRASAIQESLDELNLEAGVLLATISSEVTQSMREDELLSITEKIKRLGAINLAAIEEFGTEQQRKHYLDEQYNDLTEALTILETAIEKMDKETRHRLENTFNEVNASFKSLFPRLFGGGRAQLELTCDNLLEAGIVVMAQPPGKRNSTIHLLSGGEKAMTAVALVFAIFQLNPSPFCMLDEVDAPLDDVNVGRFCDLVKEMSQFVQFLFITHNKVTMELADHLIGVTMREPGVSRLVAVDVQEALTME